MARKFLVNIDLVKNQLINHVLHIVAGTPSSPVEGQIWYDGTADRLKYQDASTARTPWTADGDIPNAEITNAKLATNPLARANHTGTQTAATISDFDTQVRTNRLDQMTAPTASVSFNSQEITNVASPTSGTSAANRNYVDSAVAGFSWKAAVRVATVVAGTLASSFENGDTVDGVTLATGNRILIKDQASPTENGIYTVNASGAPTRATDADTGSELLGAAVLVQEGTLAGTQWIQTTDGTITLGATNIVWSQFGGGSAYTAGDGLTLTGNDFDVNVGDGILIVSDAVEIDPDVVVRKFAASVGNNSSTTLTVTHNLNTLDVIVEVYENSSGETVIADVDRTGVNAVDVIFAVAPTTNQYRVVVHG